MTLLTLDIPEELLLKLRRTGRPAGEVIVETLEQKFQEETSYTNQEASSVELARRLIASGFVRDPTEYADPEVKEWLALPETERVRIISETDSLYFSDSPASRAVIENRS